MKTKTGIFIQRQAPPKEVKFCAKRFDNWIEALNYGRELAGHPPIEKTDIPEGSTTLCRDSEGNVKATVSLWDPENKYPFLTRPQR